MTDREKHYLLGFIDDNDHYDIYKMKGLLKLTLKESLPKNLSYLKPDELIEYLELQIIIFKEVILEMEETK